MAMTREMRHFSDFYIIFHFVHRVKSGQMFLDIFKITPLRTIFWLIINAFLIDINQIKLIVFTIEHGVHEYCMNLHICKIPDPFIDASYALHPSTHM
jgi:hypothetical protein